MTRHYVASSGPISAGSEKDLLTLFLENNGYFEVERIVVTCVDTALPTAQMMQVEAIAYGDATVDTSGGVAATLAKVDLGDADPGVSAYADDLGVTGSDPQTVYNGGCYAYQGIDFVFQEPVALNPVGNTAAFVVRLAANPVGTLTLIVTVYFAERGITGS